MNSVRLMRISWAAAFAFAGLWSGALPPPSLENQIVALDLTATQPTRWSVTVAFPSQSQNIVLCPHVIGKLNWINSMKILCQDTQQRNLICISQMNQQIRTKYVWKHLPSMLESFWLSSRVWSSPQRESVILELHHYLKEWWHLIHRQGHLHLRTRHLASIWPLLLHKKKVIFANFHNDFFCCEEGKQTLVFILFLSSCRNPDRVTSSIFVLKGQRKKTRWKEQAEVARIQLT